MTSRVHRSCAHARLLRCLTPLQVAAMALLRYFQVTASLPTAEDTTLGDTVTQSANAAVLREVQADAELDLQDLSENDPFSSDSD